MNRITLIKKTEEAVSEIHDALKAVFDELNRGQQKKILRSEKVSSILKRYGVVREDE